MHFRTEKDKSITLVLVCVDDLLVCSENPATAVSLYRSLAKKYKMKLTGSDPEIRTVQPVDADEACVDKWTSK